MQQRWTGRPGRRGREPRGLLVNGTHTLLPPDGHLAIPTVSRRAAKAGLTMYTACRRSSKVAQRIAWHAVTVLGPRVLPGRRQEWRPPVEQSVWAELVGEWRRDLGSFDDVALHLRRPAYRAGASLMLLHGGTPVAFVKLRADHPERLHTERRALEALRGAATCFVAPSVLAAGAVRGWHYLALSAFPVEIHTMLGDPPLRRIVSDVSAALAPELPRPPGVDADWRPMHGDLTPWNLRGLGSHAILLFDWEGADWAPPEADLLWYDAVADVKRLAVRRSGVPHTSAVIQFWIDRLSEDVEPGEHSLAATILRRLRDGWRP